MIIGRTLSADGGYRRIPIRHTQVVDAQTRQILVDYLKDLVYKKCEQIDWVGSKDLFPNIPDDIIGTPLEILHTICVEKFGESAYNVRINILKYIGILLREAVYYSEVRYNEDIVGSARKYRLESKGSVANDYKTSSLNLINKASKE